MHTCTRVERCNYYSDVVVDCLRYYHCCCCCGGGDDECCFGVDKSKYPDGMIIGYSGALLPNVEELNLRYWNFVVGDSNVVWYIQLLETCVLVLPLIFHVGDAAD